MQRKEEYRAYIAFFGPIIMVIIFVGMYFFRSSQEVSLDTLLKEQFDSRDIESATFYDIRFGRNESYEMSSDQIALFSEDIQSAESESFSPWTITMREAKNEQLLIRYKVSFMFDDSQTLEMAFSDQQIKIDDVLYKNDYYIPFVEVMSEVEQNAE